MEDRVVEEAVFASETSDAAVAGALRLVERDRERAAVRLDDEVVGLLGVEPLLRRRGATVLARGRQRRHRCIRPRPRRVGRLGLSSAVLG